MSAKSWLITFSIIAGIGAWLYLDNQKQELAIEERRRFEESRVTTQDPLLNLAGCMANYLTPLSKMVIGDAIFDTDNNRRMSEEQVKGFEDVRDALYKKCAPMHGQAVFEKYRTLTVTMLHGAMFQVMRGDPGVKGQIALRQTVRDATNSAYVKQ